MAQGATSWQTTDEARLVIDASLDAVRVEVASETLAPEVRAVCLELHQNEIVDKGSVFLSPEEATRLADALLRAASNQSAE